MNSQGLKDKMDVIFNVNKSHEMIKTNNVCLSTLPDFWIMCVSAMSPRNYIFACFKEGVIAALIMFLIVHLQS